MNDPSLIEQTEIAAWRNFIDTAPECFRQATDLRYQYIGDGLAINF